MRREVKGGASWLAKTDLTAYFESIDHAILLSELSSAGAPPVLVSSLRQFLDTWSRTRGRGLPQGPNASRALGNFYLATIDKAMLKADVNYWRYMDDVMIVGESKAEVMAGMRLFERETRRHGLIISSSKTGLHSGAAALEAGTPVDRDEAQYFLDSRQDKKARKALRAILKESLGDEGKVDVGGATFSLWRLAQLVDKPPLRRILSRLDDLGPVARVGAAYLRVFLSALEVEEAITAYLLDADRNTSLVTESWLLACILEFPGPLPVAWVDHARSIAQDRNGVSFHRAIAVNVMALGNQPGDLAWIKSELRRDYDPEMLRAHLVALARVGRLDKTTANAVRARTPVVAPALDYLANRRALPSLVWRGQEVKMR